MLASRLYGLALLAAGLVALPVHGTDRFAWHRGEHSVDLALGTGFSTECGDARADTRDCFCRVARAERGASTTGPRA